MAVYTELSDAIIAQMIGITDDVGAFARAEGVAAGSINTVYKVTTTTDRVFYLRLSEGQALHDLAYERDLLRFLQSHAGRLGGVGVPHLRENTIGGVFFTVAEGQWAMLFDELKGRELAPFELEPSHVEQVGAFLGRTHRVLRRYGGRQNPYGQSAMASWIREIERSDVDGALKTALRERFDTLAAQRTRRRLPRAIVHGDLFVNNTKWQRGALRAVFDWEMAGVDRRAFDVGVALNAWGWRRATAGTVEGFDPALCRALLAGYRRHVHLTRAELTFGLYLEARFAAVRFWASRVRDFELSPDDGAERNYLDYREYVRRLDALDAMGPRGFRDLTDLGRELE